MDPCQSNPAVYSYESQSIVQGDCRFPADGLQMQSLWSSWFLWIGPELFFEGSHAGSQHVIPNSKVQLSVMFFFFKKNLLSVLIQFHWVTSSSYILAKGIFLLSPLFTPFKILCTSIMSPVIHFLSKWKMLIDKQL